MPKSTGQSTGSYKPQFNSECKKAVKAHQNAKDKCCTNPTSDNINEYKNCLANARNVIKQNKKEIMTQICIKTKCKDTSKKGMGND